MVEIVGLALAVCRKHGNMAPYPAIDLHLVIAEKLAGE